MAGKDWEGHTICRQKGRSIGYELPVIIRNYGGSWTTGTISPDKLMAHVICGWRKFSRGVQTWHTERIFFQKQRHVVCQRLKAPQHLDSPPHPAPHLDCRFPSISPLTPRCRSQAHCRQRKNSRGRVLPEGETRGKKLSPAVLLLDLSRQKMCPTVGPWCSERRWYLDFLNWIFKIFLWYRNIIYFCLMAFYFSYAMSIKKIYSKSYIRLGVIGKIQLAFQMH